MPMLSLAMLLQAAAGATVILAAAGLLALALRRSSASARHMVWVLGLVSALVVPAFSFALPKWEVPLVRVAAPAPQSGVWLPPSGRRATTTSPARRAAVPVAGATATGDERHSDARSTMSAVSTATIPLVVWAIGAAFVIGRMLLGLVAVQWMARRTRTAGDDTWVVAARELAAALGLRRVRFLQSDSASMPMAWGVLRPSVLMPSDAAGWPTHRLRVVLLHELAHVKRRDCLTHLVAQIVCAAYWFNPLAWMAVRRLRSERERACDDLVLQAGTRGSDYADELLDIARVMQRQRFPAVLGGATLAMAHRSQLEGRLIAILDPAVPRRGMTRARVAVAAVVFALLMISVASVQPWAEEPAATQTVAAAPSQQPASDAAQAPAQRGVAAERQAGHDRRSKDSDAAKAGPLARDLADDIAANVADQVGNAVADVAGAVVGGVVGGVVDGVVGGVTGGIAGGVSDAVQIHVNANPNPNPDPQASGHEQKHAMDPRAAAALMEALKDTDKDVRETALRALVRAHDPRMFEALVAALKDGDPDVRQQAAFGLGGLHDPRAVEPLIGVLHDVNADVRQQAIFALGQFRDKRTLEPLISALKDENPDVRQQAAFALGGVHDTRAVEPLVIALKDSNPDVRQQAAFTLGQLRDPRAVDGLTAALKDGNADVRKQAAFALGQIRY